MQTNSDILHLKSAEHLECQRLRTLNFEKCRSLFAVADHGNSSRDLESDNICTEHKKSDGMWLGDVGNAIVSEDNELIGVTSWIFGWRDGLPDVYTKVYPHLEWITNEMQKL